MAKRFLHEDDKTELQNAIAGARQIAENASTTVQEVSVVAQQAAETAEEAAENALNAYSPTNKPTASDVGAFPLVVKTDGFDIETIGTYIKQETNNASSDSLVTASGGHLYTLFSFSSRNTMCVQYAFVIGSTNFTMWRRMWFWWLGKWGEWRADLPLDGSVAMTNTLQLTNKNRLANYPESRIEFASTSSGKAGIYANVNDDVYTGIAVRPILPDATDVPMIEYRVKNNNHDDYLAIYGEHNVTKGTSALTAGSSALSTGAIYLRYE